MHHYAVVDPTIRIKQDKNDPMMQLLQDKGHRHEEEILENLREQGLSIVDIAGRTVYTN